MINKIKHKYNNLNTAAKAGIWFVVCSCLQSGIKFISLPIFANIMSVINYGNVTLYTSWFSIIYIFATLSLGKANGVFYVAMVKYPEKKDKFTTSMCGLTIFLCVITFLMVYASTILFGDWMNIGINQYFAMAIELIGYGIMLIWSLRMRFEYNHRPLLLITFIYSVGTIIIPMLTVLLFSNSANSALLKNWSGAIFAFIVGIILLILLMKKSNNLYDKDFWKYAFRFNVTLIPHYLSNVILVQSDRIIIAKIVSEYAAAIYNVAYTLGVAAQVITQALINAINPWMYKKIKEDKGEEIKKIVNPLVLSIALLIVLIVLIMPEIFNFFFPSEYFKALNVIPPVAVGVLWAFIFNLYASIELYFSGNKLVSLASFTGALLNIITNLIFIPIFGYIAAAYTTLLCDIIYAFIHTVFSKKMQKKYLQGKDLLPVLPIWSIGILTTLICLLMSVFYNYIFIRYIIVVILIIVMYLKRKSILKIFKFKSI